MSTLFSQNLSNHNEIRPQEVDFTEVLESIALTPKTLYFYGKMPENQLKNGTRRTYERPKSLAIVGTRRPTKYGGEIAYKLAYEAAKRGAVVVSGLAYGIDAAAHRGAVDAGGVTVAVLGTPIDQIYPRTHVGLAERIIETGGCVMSEVPAGTQVGEEYGIGVKYHPRTCFLERNRLISGLADVVVIPEAAERSGSLNTAAHALEQGREVFAAPGDIGRPLSRGCNRLIRQGAQPYLEPEDVLDLLFPPRRKRKAHSSEQAELLFGDTEAETSLLRVLAAGVSDGEEMVAQVRMSVGEFNQAMTMLELKGRVKSLGANQWMLS